MACVRHQIMSEGALSSPRLLIFPRVSAYAANSLAFGDTALLALGNKVPVSLYLPQDAILYHFFAKSTYKIIL
jgi:hypothetical protein